MIIYCIQNLITGKKYKNNFTIKEILGYKKAAVSIKNDWDNKSKEEKLKRIMPGIIARNKKRKCENCGKEVSLGNYSRWHGEMCIEDKNENL